RNRRPPTDYITNEALRNKKGVDVALKDPTVRVNESNGLEDQKEKAKAQEFVSPEQAARDRLALNMDPLGRFKNQTSKESLLGEGEQLKLSLDGDSDSDEKGSKASAPLIANTNDLIPTIGQLAKIVGAPMNDDVRGIDEGDGTFLNTREFKYASFFNRMKRGIAQHWNPSPEVRRRDPTGQIYGRTRRTTVLEITLDSDGAVEDIEVQRSSGLDFLDQVAVTAMRAAQPFPNPPKGMMDENGNIVFGFGFTLDFNAGPRGIRLPF
ncbi:MAG: TonB family protein, partial [Myxococcota bacterium]